MVHSEFEAVVRSHKVAFLVCESVTDDLLSTIAEKEFFSVFGTVDHSFIWLVLGVISETTAPTVYRRRRVSQNEETMIPPSNSIRWPLSVM